MMNHGGGNWGYGFGMFHFGPLFWILTIAVIAWLIFIYTRPKADAGTNTEKQLNCFSCHGQVKKSYLRCPHCGNHLQTHCTNCSEIIDAKWNFCPHCSQNLTEKI